MEQHVEGAFEAAAAGQAAAADGVVTHPDGTPLPLAHERDRHGWVLRMLAELGADHDIAADTFTVSAPGLVRMLRQEYDLEHPRGDFVNLPAATVDALRKRLEYAERTAAEALQRVGDPRRCKAQEEADELRRRLDDERFCHRAQQQEQRKAYQEDRARLEQLYSGQLNALQERADAADRFLRAERERERARAGPVVRCDSGDD